MPRQSLAVVLAAVLAMGVSGVAHAALDEAALLAQMKAMAQRLQQLEEDRKSTRLNSSHIQKSRMPSSA